jgi:hypothetical protein
MPGSGSGRRWAGCSAPARMIRWPRRSVAKDLERTESAQLCAAAGSEAGNTQGWGQGPRSFNSGDPGSGGARSAQAHTGAFDVVASALDASPDAALCALDASPDVVAACRSAEWQSLRSEGWGACSVPGPQLWTPLAPWTEPPRPTWRVPEWQKAFDAKEFPFHFFRSCREVLFRFSAATAGRRRRNPTAVRP